MKNILLPTDLSVQSLLPIHSIVEEAESKEVSIQVVHMLSLPTSISDLLSLRDNRLYSSIPSNFREAFQMLVHKYGSSVQSIHFKFMYCNTTRYLNNFIEGNNIEAVYLLSNYNYSEPLSQSISFVPFFNKCAVPVNRISLQSDVADYQNLSILLNGNESYKISNTKRVATSVSYS